MASPDRASRNLQLSQNRTSLAFRFLFQAQPAARPLASWTPGPRWHPKRAAGLPPGARAAAAEPAAGSLGSEPPGRAHRAPPGRLRHAKAMAERPALREELDLLKEKLAEQRSVLDAPCVCPDRPCKRHRTSPLPREHHRGTSLEAIFEGTDTTCKHTSVALDYLRCTTQDSQYQVTSTKDDTVVSCSAAWLDKCGYGLEDVIGRNFRHLQGPKTDACVVRRLAAAVARGEPCEGTLTNYRADGSTFQNDFVIVPVRRCRNSEPSHWLSVHGDASALHWSARSSPEIQHRAVSVSGSRGSDRSRSKSSETDSDPSGGWLDLERARSRSGSPGSSSGSSSGLSGSGSPAALETALRRAEAAEGALASMTRRAEKAEKALAERGT